jgi:hypothetical protein
MESYMGSGIKMFYFTMQLNQWHHFKGGGMKTGALLVYF